MNDLVDFGKSTVNAVMERVGRGVSRVQERKNLPYDLLESDDAYLVVFDTPGATQSDLQVRFVEGEVQVRVDRFRDFYEAFEMRFPGRGLSLDGRATLPDDAAVDAKEATATLADNGTLRIFIPKDETGVDVLDEEDTAALEDEATGSVDVETGDEDESPLDADESDESALEDDTTGSDVETGDEDESALDADEADEK